MVLLFSERKSKHKDEIREILTHYGASYISDRGITEGELGVNIISIYKETDITLNKGVAVFCDDTERFYNQHLPNDITGICDESNIFAIKSFEANGIKAIICGMGPKNTVTFSSIHDNAVIITLQRTITDYNGEELLPCEFKINLLRKYKPFSVMAAATVLLLHGVIPESF